MHRRDRPAEESGAAAAAARNGSDARDHAGHGRACQDQHREAAEPSRASHGDDDHTARDHDRATGNDDRAARDHDRAAAQHVSAPARVGRHQVQLLAASWDAPAGHLRRAHSRRERPRSAAFRVGTCEASPSLRRARDQRRQSSNPNH